MSGKDYRTLCSAALLTLALAACNGGGGDGGAPPGDVTPPAIVATLPSDGATGVARTTAVAVTFSEPLAPASVATSTISLSTGAQPVSGTVTVDGPVVAFTPSAPLALGTLFTATVAAGLTDQAGNALTDPFIWNFNTESVPWPGTRQLGTPTTDAGNGVASDGTGNVYVTGNTGGDLDGVGGDPLAGGVDFFLAKFDPAGSLLFTRQLGTVPADEARSVAVDGAGNIYVAGSTGGDLDGVGGDPLAGGVDFFLAKFDPAGSLLFTRQLGTVPEDSAFGVAAASPAIGGNIFVTGQTRGDLDGNLSGGNFDLFLTRFDPFGNLP